MVPQLTIERIRKKIILIFFFLDPLPIPSKPEIPIKQEVITENKRKSKSMFPVTSNGISQAKSLRLLWDRITGNEPPVVTDANAAYLNFFGDSKAIRQLMTAEGTYM